MGIIGSDRAPTITDSRYQALLDVSRAMVEQPTVKAVVQSFRAVLSSGCRLHGAHLYVLGRDGESLHLLEFDREADAPAIKINTEISCVGEVGRALENLEPVFLPDVPEEMLKHPELASCAAESGSRPTYVFPVSTSQQRYGLLVATKDRGQQFIPEDVELLRSLASHVAVAFEFALAKDSAELYHRQVVKERDRFRLLLETNNHVVTELHIHELFRAASASIRSYFRNDFAGFWIIDKQSNQLECVVLDFPKGKGVLRALEGSVLSAADHERLRVRVPELLSIEDLERLPARIAESIKAESIASLAIVPLATASGPLGVITMGSRGPNVLRQEDLDLLSQISTQIALAVENAIAFRRVTEAKHRLEQERLYLESEIHSEHNFEEIVGKSAVLRKVLDQIAIVASAGSTVLLHGEAGTGKELFARAIHNLSPRRERTFVRLNCAAIPSGLVESELFGHETGAFTGALMQKPGRFELADRGTLFLDEIGDLSLELQSKLLRALQEHELERLGSTKTIRVDVRLIAATHRDLPEMIRNNQFREDLFCRLNVCPIEIPALRERREDIPLLVHYFVSRHSHEMRKRIKSVPKQSMEALVKYDWPGNIRQLKNFIERCVILTRGEELNVPYAEPKKASGPSISAGGPSFEQAERQAIIDALKAASGRIAGQGGAAERLGLKRTTLQNKMNKLRISRIDYVV